MRDLALTLRPEESSVSQGPTRPEAQGASLSPYPVPSLSPDGKVKTPWEEGGEKQAPGVLLVGFGWSLR